MVRPPITSNEQSRLKAVKQLKILDTALEERFDSITREAVKRLRAPISTISIIDKDREWFKSRVGLDQTQGPRDISFCGHSMLARDIFIVEDTLLDERFADNPYVIGEPHLRFYAGVSLHERDSGLPVGVFCIKDIRPRKLSAGEIAALIELAGRVEAELNVRKQK
ncbi:hypothetical protein A3A38_04370 [Candidatus Kaiserbacteria bacterium RIFCSPLOWO2_01_FULL_53_17]|uniref:GAF domain-containing protein n=1 Tax=Candidatus Kaiserbacteria bacterium RIFCSPLOWO2_01_FULL_53_17 TaxID=1798511 RepID=A0A1F6EH26_9BACT|nr:MAG: hypothetical protein A3A38_04370 [Candidatus Kaiserbacteria bacterium RIFCSPLOWO2_01_FULL_53_17]